MPPVTPGGHGRRTPGRTPGRRHKDDYLKFNARPKEVGSRTGRAMPTNVPRNEEGFEDADAFFLSSPQSGPSSSRHQTPASRRGPASSPSTIRTNRSHRSRISDLVADDDDQQFADDLLEDDEDDVHGTPQLHFRSSPNPPRSLSVPRMNRLPLKSPSVGFDGMTSPSMSFTARRSTIGVNYKALEPRLSPTTPLRNEVSGLHSPPELEVDDEDLRDEMEVDISAEFEQIEYEQGGGEEINAEYEDADEEEQDDEPPTPTADSGKVRDPGLRKSMVGKAKGPLPQPSAGDEEDQEDGVEEGHGGDDFDESRSFREPEEVDDFDESTTFKEPEGDITGDVSGVVDTYDDYSDAGTPNVGSERNDLGDSPAPGDETYVLGDSPAPGDMTYDRSDSPEAGDETYGGIDNTIIDTDESEDEVDYDREDGDISLERQAVEEEEMDEEEEGDLTVIDYDRTPKPKRSPKKRSGSKTPRPRSEDLPAPKRSRISQFPDKSENTYTGDFKTRRSGRQHMRPLEWWRGERVEYARGEYQAVIKSVVHIPHPEPKKPPRATPRSASRARSGRSVSRSVRAASETAPPPEEGWDDSTKENALVCEYPSGREVSRRVALPRSRVNPKTVVGPDFEFQYEKIFGEEKFIASGIVEIPVGGSKPAKPSRDNAYVFYVISGAVRVELHRTSFVMAVGGQFLIPRGNAYAIENVSPVTKARLFFAQARKITASEAEEAEVLERAEKQMLSQSQNLGAVEEESEDGEDGEEGGEQEEEDSAEDDDD